MSNAGAITPVITTASGQDSGSVTEDGTLKATGQLSATEAGNSHPNLDWDVVGNGHGTYGNLTIDDNGKWTYTLNNSASNVQALAQGESVTETFTVQVSDHGKVATEVVTVHIAGSDDAPVISASSNQTGGTVQEDATLAATGKLTVTDVDHNAALTWSVANNAGTYGTLAVDQTGKWTYTLNNSASNVQALAKNEQATETFTVLVKDQFGATDTQTITVKVVGSNDAPQIAGTSTGSVQEDATQKATGQLTASDVDHGASLNWSVADKNGDFGTLAVDQSGKWTYTLNNNSSDVQALSVGQTVTDSFTVQVRDQYGTTTNQVVNVQVAGSNDAPVITSGTTSGSVKEDGTQSASGTIHATDIDHNDTLAWSVDNASGTYGSLAVDATGKWTYTLNNSASNVQALAQGETAHDSFTVRVSDGHGGTDTQVVTVNIAGTNDGPTASAPVADQVVLAQAPFSFSVAGNFADVDHGAVLHYSATLADGSPLPSWMTINATTGIVSGTPPANLSGGTLNTVTFQSESADYHNTIGAYDIDANGNITGVKLLFANASAQNSGGTLQNGVSQATIASGAGQTVGLFLIADGFDANNGFANLDLVNGHLEFRNSNGTPATVASHDPQLWYVAANGHSTELSGDVYHSVANGTTDLNLNDDRLDHVHEGTASGQTTYSFEDLSGLGDRDFNDVVVSMKQTAIPSDSLAITVTATDNYGASASDTLNINLDHPPVANADTAAGTENQTLTIDVLANDTDQDANSVLTVSTATVPQGQGSVAIVNNQVVFNPGTNFDHLAAGATQTVVVQYTIKDNFGIASSSSATITVTGTDDAPVITSGPGAGSVQEDSVVTATGQLTATDVDDGATQAWSVANGAGTYGSLAVDSATGQWTYTLNNGAANVQALSVDESHTETFTVQVSDGLGGTASQQVVVTVTGSNDAPIVTSATQAGVVQEDATLTATGQVTASDVDHLDTLSYAVQGTGAGVYGALAVDSTTGQWTYALNNGAANVQALSAGESHTETFTVQVSDGNGGTTSQDVAVTITGTNDAPVVTSAVQTGSVQEDSVLTATGQVTGSDVDHLDTLSYAVVGDGSGTYGALAIDSATGAWTYTLNNSASNVQALSAGESHTETFTVQISDGQGGTTSQQVTVNVAGSNDGPVITSADQTGVVQEDSVLTATGQVTASDVDHLDTLSYAVVGDGSGTYGSLAVDSTTGQWTYSLNNGATNVQALSAGESHTETFTVLVSDGQGGTTSQDVAVTITGTNDAPVVTSAAQTGSVQEDSVLTTTGQVTGSDVDHLDTLSYAVVGDGSGTYGALAVDSTTGQWTYSLNNGAANVQALSAGESHTETFTVQISDGQGGTTSQQVIVNVAGSNDGPVVTSADQAGAVQEDTTLTATGQVTASDIDDLDVLSYAVVGDGSGTYGALAVDSATGQWTYTLNNGAANVQALSAGESHTETFTVQVFDGQGGTTSQDVAVTVTGTNDAPVITSVDQAGAVQEDATLVATGQVTASDVDHLDTLSYAVVGDGSGTYGSLAVDSATGQWTYSLNNGAANVQALSAGESHTETFTVLVSDGQGGTTSQDVAVTVTGTDDAPVITSTVQAGNVQEDSVLTTTGQVTASDIDHLDTLSYAVVGDGSGTYGSLAVDSTTGQWTYSLNNGAANVQALSVGEAHTETFTVLVSDGQGGTTSQDVVVTVAGSNDGPVVTSADQAGAVQEDTTLTATGQVTASDVDHLDTLSYAVVGDGSGTYGSLAVDSSTGQWTYSLNDNAANVQALSVGESHTETFTVAVSDGNGGTTSQQVTVNVTGTDDAPVITSAAQAGAAQEDATLTATGQVTASDVDHLDTLSYAVVGDGSGTYGSLAVDPATGQWTYSLNNGAANVQALSSGESHTESFTVQVSDGQGGTTSQDVIVTVTGTNDAPLITSADQAGAVQEDSVLAATGQVTASDVDHLDTLSYAVTGDGNGIYGALEVDSTTGQWTYTLNNGAANVQALSAGESHTETFTVLVSDGQGGSTSQDVAVTVTGTEDVPLITSADQAGTVQEDSVLTATGQVTASDVDHLDTLSYAVVGDGNGAHGSLAVDAVSGQWTYTLANDAAAVQSLGEGETVQDTFTVQVDDGHGGIALQQVTASILGTNDAPVVFDVAGTADQNTPVDVALNYYDPDAIDTDTVALFETIDFHSSASGSHSLGGSTSGEHDVTDGYLDQGGHAHLNADGTVTFDPGHDFDYLGAGEAQDVVFNYAVTDNHGAVTTGEIDITVTGENDAPVAFDTSATADQNTPVSFALPTYDPDETDTDTVTLFQMASESSGSAGPLVERDISVNGLAEGGHATLNGDGTVTFDPGHDFDYLGAGESQVVEFEYRVTDSSGASATATIDVTVTGENDAPVVFNVAATADQNAPVDVALNYYDPDQTDTDTVMLFETVSGGSSGSAASVEHDVTDGYLAQGGHTVLNADGTVSFDPGHDFDYLGAGETQDVVFNYAVTDSHGVETDGVIDITIIGENDAPVAFDVSAGTDQFTPATFALNYSDIDANDTDTVTLFQNSFGGSSGDSSGGSGFVQHDVTDGYLNDGTSLHLNGDGTVTFDTNHQYDYLSAGETVQETVGYRVTDSQGATATGEIDVTITGVNVDPTLSGLPSSLTDQESQPITVPGFNLADINNDDTLTVTLSVAHGTIQFNPPSFGIEGYLTVTQTGNSVTISGPNAANYLTPLFAGDTSLGSFSYTADAGFNGTDTITVTAADDHGGTTSGTIAVNDIYFTTAPDMASGTQNQILTIDVLANDIGSALTLTDAVVPNGQGSVSVVDNQLVFNPGTDFNYLGQDETQTVVASYTVQDDLGEIKTETAIITVTGINDAPRARPDAAATSENQSITIDVVANDTDVDDGPVLTLATVGVIGFGEGTATILANRLVFNPGTDFDHLAQGVAQSVTVNYTVQDEFGATSASTATITVVGTNDVPVAAADTAITDQNTSTTVDVLANDGDLDFGDVLTVASVSIVGDAQGRTGIVSIVNNQVVFDPGSQFASLAQGQSTTNIVTYMINDAHFSPSTSTATITVTGTNDAPVAVADVASITENQSIAVNVLANDTDADDGHVLTLATVGVAAGQGSVSIVNNQLVFNPGADFDHLAQGATQNVVVNYTVQDEFGATSASTATITVTGTNDAPTAVADTATTDQNTATTLNVLANDTDPDSGDVLTVTNVSITGDALGRTGTASIVNNQVVFNQNTQFVSLGVGQSTTNVVTYTINDGHGGTSTATDTITVTGINDAPVAIADTATTDQNTAKTINVLANDIDQDRGDTLTITNAGILVGDAQGRTGTVSIVNNQVVFDPNGQFVSLAQGQSTTNTVFYTVSDGHGGISQAVDTITVTGVNDAPVAVADTATMTENNTAPLTINVLANDTDVDAGHVFTLGSVSVQAGLGSASIVGNQFVYTPPAGGTFDHLAQGATLTINGGYTMHDEFGAGSFALVTITVTGVNDAPVAVADTAFTNVRQAVTINVLANDTDADDSHVQILSAASVSAAQGSVSIVNNQLVYNPGTAFDSLLAGQDQIVVVNYTMNDEFGAGTSSTATILVHVTNHAPVAVADTGATTENAVATIDVLANDTDVDAGHVFTLASVSAVTSGSVSIVNNQLVFDPGHDFDYLAAGATKSVVVNYTMHDEFGQASSATETITVTGTNDAPVAINETVNGTEGTPVTGNVLSGTYDPDVGNTLTVSNAGNLVGTFGTLTLNANGTYSYSLSSAAATALGAGQTDTDTFTYTATDGTASASATLTVHVAGMATATAADETITGATMGVGITNQIPAYVPNNNPASPGYNYGQYPAAPAATGFGALINGLGGTPAGFGTAFLQSDDGYQYMSLDNLGSLGKDLQIQFFGQSFDHFYLDNNGLISFNAGVASYTGQAMPVASLPYPMIAAYWEDVDTRGADDTAGLPDVTPTTPGGNSTGSDQVYYYVDGNTGVIIVTWDDVGTYNLNDRAPNAFQLMLMPTLTGGYSAVFRYESINMAYGEVSGNVFPQVGFQDGQGHNFNAQGTLTNQLGNLETLTNTIPALPGIQVYNISGTTISNGLQTVGHTLLDNDAAGAKITAVNGSASLVDTIFTLANGGQLMIMPDGVYNYVAPSNATVDASLAAGETSTETVSYTVTVGTVSTVEHLNIVTTGTNNAPQPVADIANVALGGSVDGNLFANDSDIDHNTVLRLGTAVAGPGIVGTLIAGAGIYHGSFGTLDVQMDGSYHYTVDSTYHGAATTDVFAYALSDGIATNPSSLTVNVGATMSATNDAVSVDKAHTVVTGNVLTNDLTGSHTGQPLTVTGELDQVGTYGTLFLNSNGTYTYKVDTSNGGLNTLFSGQTVTDNFTYQVTDGITTQQATVAVTYAGGATAPTVNAADDHVTLTAGGSAYGFDSTPYLSQFATTGTGALGTSVVPTNLDDGSVFVDLSTLGPGGTPLSFEVGGVSYTGLYINTNGSVTFTQADPTWHAGAQPGVMIAPFFADVDLTANPAGHITYNVDNSGIVTVTWDHVAGYTNGGASANTDSFQLQLVNQGHGETDAIFRYGTMQWTQSTDMTSASVYADVGLDYSHGNSFLATPATAAGTGSLATSSNVPGTPAPGAFVIDNVDDATGSHTYSAGGTGASFAGSVLANDGGATSVTALNGVTTSVDHTVTLASGAQITMYADGEYIYRTGSAFDYLGAGQQATDSFTYVSAGATHTVTMTINGAGSDTLFTGTSSANTLVGGTGNDTLVGGPANDTLTGGLGHDTFVFNAPSDSVDTITDFNHGQGDVIDISAIGFGHGLVADQSVSLVTASSIGTANHVGSDGDFIFIASTGNLYWDATSGSGTDAILLATLTGVTTLTQSDFHVT